MKKRFVALFISLLVFLNFLWLPNITFASNNSQVRVKLTSLGSLKSADVTIPANTYGISEIDKNNVLDKGSYKLSISSGKIMLNYDGISKDLGTKFTFKRYDSENSNLLKVGPYSYLGDMEVRVVDGSMVFINHINLETYLYGVVPYEIEYGSPQEVQKVQAVASRTYALMSKNSSSYFDLHDTISSQVYRGYDAKYTDCIKAVNDTRGVVLKYGNSYAETFYSASNGGMTESSANLWGGSCPYLMVKKDDFDQKYPPANANGKPWKVTYSKKNLDQNLLKRLSYDKYLDSFLKNNSLNKDDIQAVEISKVEFEYNSSNRASNGKIYFKISTKLEENNILEMAIPVYAAGKDRIFIRDAFKLNSLLFEVLEDGDKIVFDGVGWGHGIGMSQYGAYARAEAGHSYQDILTFYYHGTKLETISISADRGATRPDNPTNLGGTKPETPKPEEPKPETPKPEEPKPEPPAKKYAKVNVNTYLNVRKGPGTTYGIVTTLKRGTRVEVLDRNGAWYKIVTGNHTAYAHGDYIVLEETQTPPVDSGNQPSGSNTNETALPPEKDDRRYGTVTASALNVRSGPSTKNHKVGMFVRGAKVTILGSQSGWYKISFNGKDAYIHGDYIRLDSSAPDTSTTTTTGTSATVNASSLNVRSGAGTGHKIIGRLARNSKVETLGKEGTWYKIKYGASTGFVHADYLKFSSSSSGGTTAPSTSTGTVNASSLHLRSGAGSNYRSLVLIPRGKQVTILGTSGSWLKVQYGSITGYVYKSYIR